MRTLYALHETFGNFINTVTSGIFTAINIQDMPSEGGHLNI